jgi:hypothetical protein
MISQAPFVIFGRLKLVNNKKIMNLLMWFSLFLGQPLMLLLYFKDWYNKNR